MSRRSIPTTPNSINNSSLFTSINDRRDEISETTPLLLTLPDNVRTTPSAWSPVTLRRKSALLSDLLSGHSHSTDVTNTHDSADSVVDKRHGYDGEFKEELETNGDGIRQWYDNFTAIDWIHDAVRRNVFFLIGILDRNLIQIAGERILTNTKITKRKTKWCQGLRIELYRRWQRCVDVHLLSQGGTDLLHINDNRMGIGNDYWFLNRRCGVRNNIQRDASLRLEVWVLLERLETAETILLQSYFVILPRNF
jgi:hypothetical protein